MTFAGGAHVRKEGKDTADVGHDVEFEEPAPLVLAGFVQPAIGDDADRVDKHPRPSDINGGPIGERAE